MTTFPSELLPPMTSASQLQTWASCGRKYAAKYVLHLAPEYRSTALVVGSVVHSVLGFHYEERRDGRTVSREHLQRIIQADLAAEIAESNLRWKDETPESLEAEVTRLVSLYLDGNRLKCIAGLESLRNLSSVSLSRNRISDVDPLAGLRAPSFFLLENNQIKDLWPILKACMDDARGPNNFAPFLNLYLKGNPLEKSGEEQLEELKKLGVRVNR